MIAPDSAIVFAVGHDRRLAEGCTAFGSGGARIVCRLRA